MKLHKTTSFRILYLISASLILGIKYWYRSAGSNELDWILSPTARWVEILCGIPFEKVPNLGYINHSLRFIIAPSCSGVQFMLIAFATLCFPFLHRMETARQGSLWIAISLPTAYLYSIASNGIRITLSIYIPALLGQNLGQMFWGRWLTPEKLHTMIGTAVYFTSLLLLYYGTEILYQRIDFLFLKKHPGKISEVTSPKIPSGKPFLCALFQCMPPALCYFSIVLVIPLFGRIYRNNWDNFAEYALLTAAVCLAILFLAAHAVSLCKRNKK